MPSIPAPSNAIEAGSGTAAGVAIAEAENVVVVCPDTICEVNVKLPGLELYAIGPEAVK